MLVEERPVEVEPASLRDRLAKARLAFTGALTGVLGRSGITEESFEDLEEALLRADVGVGVTTDLIDGLRAKVAAKEITEPQALLDELEAEMVSRLDGSDRTLAFDADADGPNVWMFVGVNGVGKTTTIGKLANQQMRDGRTVLLAAGDTFRAAAAEQLTTWAERSGAEIVRGAEGGDPSSVIYDGVERAAARGHPARDGRHCRAPAHEVEPHGGAEEGAPGCREGRGPGDRDAAGDRRDDRAERTHPGPRVP